MNSGHQREPSMIGTRKDQLRGGTAELAPLGKDYARLALDFAHCPQAARTDLDPLRAAVLLDSHCLNVGLPLALGPHIRVADTMPKRWAFTADFALGHDCTSLT
jgi:hypothetical protein